MKLGATASTVSTMRSAAASRSSSQLRPSGKTGANCWQNRLATWAPAGARLSSTVEGISISTIGAVRPAELARVDERAVHVIERRRDDDAAHVVLRRRLAGQAGEIGQLGERHVHAERARAGPITRHAPPEVGREVGRVDQLLIEDAWADVGDDPRRGNLLARLEADAHGRAAIDKHLAHRRFEHDLDACIGAGGGHGLGDRAHAADRMTPRALLAVHLAEHVMEQNIGRARRVGAGVVADHRVEAERRLDRLALEPAVQEGARALGEEVDEVALALERQLRQRAPLRRRPQQRLKPTARVRRGLERQIAQHVGHAVERGVVGRQSRCVAGGEPGELGLGARKPAPNLQIAAVRLRQHVGDRPLDDAQAALVQAHVGDHLRVQQADRVARRRVAEARVELFRHRRTADDRPALEHAHGHPGARQVEGADEAIVPAADDDGVQTRPRAEKTPWHGGVIADRGPERSSEG